MVNIVPHAVPNTGARRNGVVNPLTSDSVHLGNGSPIPAVYMPDYSSIPVYYQRQLPTCGANAGTFLSDVLNARVGSPRGLWIRMREIDGLAPTDGSALSTIGQALKLDGVVDLNLLPDDTTLTPQEYMIPSVLTPEMNLNAITAGIDSLTVYTAPFSIAQIKQLIYSNKAVIALVKCGTGWWTKNGNVDWTTDLFPVQLGTFSDDHYVVLVGYDQNYIYFRNSWSNAWGKVGIGYFDSTYLANVVQIGVGNMKTTPSVGVVNTLVNWYKKMVGKK